MALLIPWACLGVFNHSTNLNRSYQMAQHEFAFRSSGTYLNGPTRSAAPAMPFALAGLTFDGAVTNRPGARFGPQAIRLASQMLCDATHPHFETTPLGHLCDAGDLPMPNTGVDAMRAALMPQALELFKQHHMVWLGGDHSVTLPLLRALNQVHGGPVAMVHFDAHCDTWTNHFGEPSGHGTWVYEAMQEGIVAAAGLSPDRDPLVGRARSTRIRQQRRWSGLHCA
ncbi:arginase family protein [Undibacterium arcticum]